MPYSFVWLYLMKCVFTCSIFVNSSTKRFLSVLGVFGKYFVWKIWKFQKSCFALFWRLSCGYVKSRASVASSLVIFGDLFASGRSSREVHSEIFAAQLTTHSRVDLPVAKTLRKIFQIFVLECFGGLIWRLFGDSFQSRKSRVLEILGQFLNFLFFPRSFCDCSLSFSSALTHSHRASIVDLHYLPLFSSKSSTNRYGSLSCTLIFLMSWFSLWIIHFCLWFCDGFCDGFLWCHRCPFLAYGSLYFWFWANLSCWLCSSSCA